MSSPIRRTRWCLPIALLAAGGMAAQAPTTAADSLAMTLAIYTKAFTNAVGTAHAAALPEVICIQGQSSGKDPAPEVLAMLQKDRTTLIRPYSACITEPLSSTDYTSMRSLVVDTLTKKRGISVSAGQPTFAEDGTFKVSTGYYQHGLSSAGWSCVGTRKEGAWELSCRMTWIS